MRGTCLLSLAVALATVGCNDPSGPAPKAASTAEASAPEFTRTAAPEPTAAAAATESTATASGAAAAEPAAPPSAAAEALPEVELKTIGMHIGGGPNDKETKAPIRGAVEAKLDGFRACFAKVDEPSQAGTFGVDILIPGEGGRAKITEPRSGLKGDGVKDCMVAAFESIEFARPPRGVPMKVSYSIRLTPK